MTAATALSISDHRVIGLRAVERRPRLVLGDVVGDEFLVGLVGQVVDPFLRAGNADREVLEPRQRQLVDGEHLVERDLPLEAGLRVLGDELHAGAAGIEHENHIRLGRARLGQFGREVELVRPAGVFLADDLALVGELQPGQHVLAGGVVGTDQEDAS